MQHTPALTGKACEEFDPSAGDLYVMDAGHGVIDKFSPEGSYLSQIGGFPPSTGSAEGELLGLGVDASGAVHVGLKGQPGQPAGRGVRHRGRESSHGSHSNGRHGTRVPVTGFAETPFAHGFAVSATGDNYPVYEPSCSCTIKFGQRLSALGRVDSGEAGDVAVAVDPATGHLYADDQSSVAEWDTGAMNRNSDANEATGESAKPLARSSRASARCSCRPPGRRAGSPWTARAARSTSQTRPTARSTSSAATPRP